MRNFDIDNHLAMKLENLKGQVINDELIASLCNELKEESSNEFCHIIWCKEDIEAIRPHWSSEKIDEVASKISKFLNERSTVEGWEYLEIFLSEFD